MIGNIQMNFEQLSDNFGAFVSLFLCFGPLKYHIHKITLKKLTNSNYNIFML